jgi:hypothetical protein
LWIRIYLVFCFSVLIDVFNLGVHIFSFFFSIVSTGGHYE